MFANVVMYKNLIYIALVSLSYLTSFDRDLGENNGYIFNIVPCWS